MFCRREAVILMASSTGTHSCCAGFGCWFFSFFSFFTKSGVLYTYYFIHIFTETKKILYRLNLVLTYGISPEFRGGVHLLI